MKTITFTCETITPMFLSGADGQTPELRPPSIKGALRFWWRAMNGHLVNTENGGIPNLLKEDERLFGGVNGGGKSSVLVRVANMNEILIDGRKLQSYADYDRNNRKVPYKKEGLAYLYYVLLNQKLQGLEGFDVETTFDVTLSSENQKDLLQAIACFWLFVYLGSMGSRARRGAGAIAISKDGIKGNIEVFENTLSFHNNTANDISFFVNQNLNNIKTVFEITANQKGTKEYSSLYKAPIFISKNEKTYWYETLDEIGDIMRKLRKGKGNFKRENRTFTMDTLDEKAAFGLPIRVQDDNELNFLGNDYNKRASPIYISIIKNANDKFNWIVVHLQGDFMPPNSSLNFESINTKMTYPKTVYPFPKEKPTLLNKFITEISSATISHKITI